MARRRSSELLIMILGLMEMMFAQGQPPQGQAAFTNGTTVWTVPAGVYSVCAVCVQGGTTTLPTRIVSGATTVCQAQYGARIGDGGGSGGNAGGGSDSSTGAGGAGGYTGNGGNGGTASVTSDPGIEGYNGTAGAAGSGGGGGGGGGGSSYHVIFSTGGTNPTYVLPGENGGGVGLLGVGSSGAGGYGSVNGTSPAAPGAAGSGGSGITYGGGVNSSSLTSTGGELAWKNNIPVVPGATLTVDVSGNGGARIIWGGGRSYPSNAGNV